MTAGTASSLAGERRWPSTRERARHHGRILRFRRVAHSRWRGRAGRLLERSPAAQGQPRPPARRSRLPAGDAGGDRQRRAVDRAATDRWTSGRRHLPRLPVAAGQHFGLAVLARDTRPSGPVGLPRPRVRSACIRQPAGGIGRARTRHRPRAAVADRLLAGRRDGRCRHAAAPPGHPDAAALVAGGALLGNGRQRRRHPHRVPGDRPAPIAAGAAGAGGGTTPAGSRRCCWPSSPRPG